MVTDRPRVACNLPVATGLIRRSRCCVRSFIGLATEAFAQLIAIADTDNVARLRLRALRDLAGWPPRTLLRDQSKDTGTRLRRERVVSTSLPGRSWFTR